MSIEKKASQLASLYIRKIAKEDASVPGEQVLPSDIVSPDVKNWWEENVVNEPLLNNPSLKWGLGLGAGAGLLSYLTADDDEGGRKDRDLARRLLLGALGGGATGMLWNQFSSENPEVGAGAGRGASGAGGGVSGAGGGVSGANGGTNGGSKDEGGGGPKGVVRTVRGIGDMISNLAAIGRGAYAGIVNNPISVIPPTLATMLFRPARYARSLYQILSGQTTKKIKPYPNVPDRLAAQTPVIKPKHEGQRGFNDLVIRAIRDPADDMFTPRTKDDVRRLIENEIKARHTNGKPKISPSKVFDELLPTLARRPNGSPVPSAILDSIRTLAGEGTNPSPESTKFLKSLPEDLRTFAEEYALALREHGQGKIRTGKSIRVYPKSKIS